MGRCKECPKNAYYGNPGEVATHCRSHREHGMINVGVPLCAETGCTSTSRAFGFPGGKGVRCKKHALPGMINVANPRCEHSGCESTSVTFDVPGGKGRFCKDHASSTMVNVRNRLCEYDGCSSKSRNFDFPGGKGRFCKTHKEMGMIDVLTQKCIHPGCETRANFGEKGKPARYCAIHKLSGMCNRHSCEHDGCTKFPGHNFPGETTGRFCASHTLDGMVNVRVRICKHPSCKKSASFGSNTPQFCKTHAEDGMRNLLGKRCEHPECDLHASYNLPGKRPKFCQSHSKEGMTIVIGKGCEYVGCGSKSHYYDIPGGKGRFCTKHREPNMVDVMNPKCDQCDSLASYGIPGGKKTRCTKHRAPGMLSRPRARCVVCRKPAFYGKSFVPNHCEAHKHADDDNLMERECVSCHLPMVLDTNGKCEFCDPVRFETNRLAKQNALMEYLNRKGLKGNSTDVIIDKGICGKERPDRVFDFEDKIVILECDEHQHKDRQCSCEQTRMVNISQSYGGVPVYFLRWNPDNYTSVDGKLPDAISKRHKLVADFIRDIRDNAVELPKGLLSVLYLYYDGWTNLSDVEWTVITPYQ